MSTVAIFIHSQDTGRPISNKAFGFLIKACGFYVDNLAVWKPRNLSLNFNGFDKKKVLNSALDQTVTV